MRFLLIIFCFQFFSVFATEDTQVNVKTLKRESSFKSFFKDVDYSGQVTIIDQSSDLGEHGRNGSTVSGDFIIDKKLGEASVTIDIQFAKGEGIDSEKQGGAMVNNDVMEDPENKNLPYIAKFFYHNNWGTTENYALHLDIGKFGVNDFFDPGLQVSDQTTQFLNQAINNNGAFDYVQDLVGHGYTYGLHMSLENDQWGIDAGLFSADADLGNVESKYSTVVGLKWTPSWAPGEQSFYQIFAFKNVGEYGRFTSDGGFTSKDEELINTKDNKDSESKTGYGLNINHAFGNGLDLFCKFGKQDDTKDVRHYQDMDQTYLVGMAVQGHHWSRENDSLGIAYEVGQLTGNHRKAHEKGYASFFDRSEGIGAENYADETVLEVYYRFALNTAASISLDYQNIRNFNYDKSASSAHFMGTRFNYTF